MKNEKQETTYKVRLFCRKCQSDWIENVEKGTYVRYEKDNNYMIQIREDYKKRKNFKCPKCGAHKKIARLPLT